MVFCHFGACLSNLHNHSLKLIKFKISISINKKIINFVEKIFTNFEKRKLLFSVKHTNTDINSRIHNIVPKLLFSNKIIQNLQRRNHPLTELFRGFLISGSRTPPTKLTLSERKCLLLEID